MTPEVKSALDLEAQRQRLEEKEKDKKAFVPNRNIYLKRECSHRECAKLSKCGKVQMCGSIEV